MTGQQLKLQGMSRAAAKHAVELAEAKNVAIFLSGKPITVEDVRNYYEAYCGPWDLGNAAGAVFDPEHWECVGRIKAKRPEAHSREIKVWRLK